MTILILNRKVRIRKETIVVTVIETVRITAVETLIRLDFYRAHALDED